MNIFRLAFEIFAIYILYRLVFDFIIPIYNTTKRVKKQFGEMHDKMQEQMNKYNQQQTTASKVNEPKVNEPKKDEEYIDYEEIK